MDKQSIKKDLGQIEHLIKDLSKLEIIQNIGEGLADCIDIIEKKEKNWQDNIELNVFALSFFYKELHKRFREEGVH